jgi:UDP-N-acetylglucosamine--N-acetylmuramyl-(pentapeptide) pyrophosphoryl-undecaprenol N-acetylglucosamine transferase
MGLLRVLQPALVVGVGGYASVAVVLAAWLRRIPTVLLEQNVVPGAANRVLAFARRICLGFAEAASRLPPGKTVHTGNPLRASVLRAAPAARDGSLGLLVFGGSAGAHHLNEATVAALRDLDPRPALRVTHQTGPSDVDAVRAGYAALGVAARVEPFITDMGAAYAAADLVVSRAGAMSCAEITAVGLPAILVPYPHAADDHQRLNAEVLVRAGAAEMILDRDLTPARLAAALRTLADDSTRRATMAAQARTLGRPDAAAAVADECLSLIR